MGRTIRNLGWVLLFGVVLHPARTSAADTYDDVERRLKTTGVSVPLAKEITRTIRRGAAFLLSKQERNGNWGPPGPTALIALALVHTGDPKARDAADNARRWLQRSHAGKRAVLGSTYEAGIMAMLLQALAPEDPMLTDIQSRLARGATGSGQWGYKATGESGAANLSTSQFACLGLWAAERAGRPRKDATWKIHGDALVTQQHETGSWGYWPTSILPGHAYPTGTFMGLADVVLALPSDRPGSAAHERRELERWYRVDWARRRGQAGMARHARWVVGHGRGSAALQTSFYGLYALEKACIFLGVEETGGFDWYARGARGIIDGQLADGSFAQLQWQGPVAMGQPHTISTSGVSTAFALLFLLRASEVYRPITPRPVPTGRPRGPITGEGSRPETPAVASPPKGTARPPLALAYRLLDRLEARSKRIQPKDVEALQRLLEFVRRTFPRYVEHGKAIDTAHDAWVRRAEQLLVPLAVPALGSALTREPWRLVLAADALDALSQGTARGGIALQKALPAKTFEAHGIRRLGMAWYHACFTCLRRLDVPKFATWLLSRHIDPDPGRQVVTIPALMALEQVREPDPKARRRLARTLLHRMRKLEPAPNTPGALRHLRVDVLHCAMCLLGHENAPGGFSQAGKTLRAWRRELGAKR